MVRTNPTRGNNDGLRLERELAGHGPRAALAARPRARGKDLAAHAVDQAAGRCQRADAVAKFEDDDTLARRRAHARNERSDHARSGAPSHVKARHRVAMLHRRITAALSPTDNRKPADAQRPEPGPLLARGKADVGLCPTAGPVILAAIEAGRA